MTIAALKSLAWEKLGTPTSQDFLKLSEKDPKIFEKLVLTIQKLGQAALNQCSSVSAVELESKKLSSVLLAAQEATTQGLEQNFVNAHIGSSDRVISHGYGEYIVYYNEDDKQELSKETFDQVYAIFCRYTPAAIVEYNLGKGKEVREEYANRYALICTQIKQIDPRLHVAFIPRVLYELVLIQECINEDIKRGTPCKFLNPKKHRSDHLERKINALQKWIDSKQKKIAKLDEEYDLHPEDLRKRRFIEQDKGTLQNEIAEIENEMAVKKSLPRRPSPECWHCACFDSPGALPENQNEQVKFTAYRLNQIFARKCEHFTGALSYQKLAEFTEKEIQFLKSYYKEDKERPDQETNYINCLRPGPSAAFAGNEYSRGLIRPMGLRNDLDATIIRMAMALECSAQNSVLLYRGAESDADVPYCRNNEEEPYRLSYGSGLFAGLTFDMGATAFQYMRNGPFGYAIPIPIEEFGRCPFYVPPTNALVQFYGTGEEFHGGTKAWNGISLNRKMHGVHGFVESLDHLHSNLEKKEFLAQFEGYKKSAIILKIDLIQLEWLKKIPLPMS